MVQTIEQTTRHQFNNGTIQQSTIDHIYNKNPNLLRNIKEKQITTSGHLGIWAKKLQKCLQKDRKPKDRETKKMDVGKDLKELQSENIVEKMNDLNASKVAEYMQITG